MIVKKGMTLPNNLLITCSGLRLAKIFSHCFLFLFYNNYKRLNSCFLVLLTIDQTYNSVCIMIFDMQ